MKIIELFCGTKSFSKVAEERGHETFTIDFEKSFNPDLCIDILNFDVSMLPENFRNPDVIWSSPPCTTFSCASLGHHWKDKKPITKEAETGLKIIEKTISIIKQLNPKYFFIENPMGMLRIQEMMQQFKRQTVTYCQYGDTRMKPTDLWTNFNFIGRRCKNGDRCHVSAPRGSKTGTQGLKDAKERSIIPSKLCIEILSKAEATYSEYHRNDAEGEGK